ncbi:TPA: DUF2313 domain-containing protein [Klebsiella pneumoniae]|nr:DUF2313 domain-containing protein [Klebsiella pneumoniae]
MEKDKSNRQPRDVALYAGALLNLLPSGLAWDKKPGGALSRLMQALGGAFSRVDSDKCQLINAERTPEHALWLLNDWEEFLGLPECDAGLQTVAQRQLLAASKLKFYGSLNIAFYEQLAASYGYQIQIEEPEPYKMKVLVLGNVSYREATVLDHCETPLAIYDVADLSCALERYKPAHEVIIYAYEE